MNKKNFKTLIIMCWILLAVCVVIKLFGGNWFELSTDNTKFIEFCNYVDNTMWLKMTIPCLVSLCSNYILLCVLLNKTKLNIKECIIFGTLLIFKSIISWYITWLPFILDIFILILIPLLLCKFKYWKRILIGNVLVMVFQLISLMIRNLGVILILGNTYIEQFLYQIDYFVMLILYYLYNTLFIIKRKEK